MAGLVDMYYELVRFEKMILIDEVDEENETFKYLLRNGCISSYIKTDNSGMKLTGYLITEKGKGYKAYLTKHMDYLAKRLSDSNACLAKYLSDDSNIRKHKKILLCFEIFLGIVILGVFVAFNWPLNNEIEFVRGSEKAGVAGALLGYAFVFWVLSMLLGTYICLPTMCLMYFIHRKEGGINCNIDYREEDMIFGGFWVGGIVAFVVIVLYASNVFVVG